MCLACSSLLSHPFLLRGLCMAGIALSNRANPNHTPGRPQQEVSLPPPPSAKSFFTSFLSR